MNRGYLPPVYSVTARRALIRDMFDMGMKPVDMTEHLRRELGRVVTLGTIYNDIKHLRAGGVIRGRAGETQT
ncbi:hypothetical protein [Ruegeria atlantica]|uniref:hypothetical protein n=1 Tax=Ruegeria atlantica TaxID=81569 RepID=UPI00147D4F83|nr:hypothetical protein [Ruegeria atlantica]